MVGVIYRMPWPPKGGWEGWPGEGPCYFGSIQKSLIRWCSDLALVHSTAACKLSSIPFPQMEHVFRSSSVLHHLFFRCRHVISSQPPTLKMCTSGASVFRVATMRFWQWRDLFPWCKPLYLPIHLFQLWSSTLLNIVQQEYKKQYHVRLSSSVNW